MKSTQKISSGESNSS